MQHVHHRRSNHMGELRDRFPMAQLVRPVYIAVVADCAAPCRYSPKLTVGSNTATFCRAKTRTSTPHMGLSPGAHRLSLPILTISLRSVAQSRHLLAVQSW